jgi:single-stranded-DNA-specific exonuclease
MREATWTLRPCDPRQAAALARALGVTETTASVLIRRGYGDPDRAATFLAGAPPGHDPFLLGDMRAACERIRQAIAAGTRICVHGDYDVDGICATALAVLTLRELGAEVEWHLPSRFEEGYGVVGETLTRLAAEGCGLVLTVDCGITAVDEVREARAAGLDLIVTDHHRPGETLPDCPVVATRPSDYPFPELSGTGVVYKLAEALLGAEAGNDAGQAGRSRPKTWGDERLVRHLDLVALATIADVVPLVDENRALALAGLRRLATTTRPGLRALMHAARVDPATVDEGAVGFRLAPRINAAGRLGRPTAALELLLTEDEDEARRVAAELEELNRERQAVEERILREATAAIEAWPETRRRHRGYVVADEGWHEGVIGIVASRLVERYHRPVVLVAGAEGDWKGSGRSIPAFDLHAGLAACAEHLERFGGHRAAAGLSIRPENVEALAAAFAAHANEHLADDDLRPVTVVDAIVPGAALTLDLCAELRRLAPFGLGNPGVTLLVAGCELNDLTAVGDGKHLRFRVRDARGPAGTAIAFGLGSQLDRFRRVGHYDVAFRLQENTWNGTSAPQLVVRRIFETPERYLELRERLAAEWRAGRLSPEAEAIAEELGLEPGGPWRSLLESETFRMLLEEPLVELRRAA